LEEDGFIGRAYGAQATPQIFIVDPGGTLVYAGGLDDGIASAGAEGIDTGTNYVSRALDEIFGGRPISTALTRPRGSAIHYQA